MIKSPRWDTRMQDLWSCLFCVLVVLVIRLKTQSSLMYGDIVVRCVLQLQP